MNLAIVLPWNQINGTISKENTLNFIQRFDFGEESSAEYAFFQMLFAIMKRNKVYYQKDPLFNFAWQVSQYAEKHRVGKLSVKDYDRVVNGHLREGGIDWQDVQDNFTDYESVLSYVPGIIEMMTNNQGIKAFEIKKLEHLAQLLLNYRKNEILDDKFIEKWKDIKLHLGNIKINNFSLYKHGNSTQIMLNINGMFDSKNPQST